LGTTGEETWLGARWGVLGVECIADRDARHRDFPKFSFVGDAGGVQARRALQRILVDDET
jgi:hypothetical protein